MTQSSGANSQILLGYESTFGTAATTGYIMPYYDITPGLSKAFNSRNVLRNSLNPSEPFKGNTTVDFTIRIPIDSLCFGYWLKGLFGAPTSAGADPYTHTYEVPAVNARPSLTLETQHLGLTTDKYIQTVGAKIVNMSFEIGGDGELIASIGIRAKNQTKETSSMDASPTSVTPAYVSNSNAAITEGGSAFSYGIRCSYNIDALVDSSDDQFTIGGGGLIGALPDMVWNVSGSLRYQYNDTTDALVDKGLNTTESAVKSTITESASSIFDVEVPELKYNDRLPGVPGPQGVVIDGEWIGYYTDDADASVIIFVLTNGEATYP